MGVSASKASISTNTTTILETANTAIVSANQGCDVSQFATNNMTFKGTYRYVTFDLRQITDQFADIKCTQIADVSVDFNNRLETAIDQKLQATAKAGQTIGYSSSDTSIDSVTTNIQRVANTLNVSSLQSCMANITAGNSITFDGVIEYSTITAWQQLSQKATIGCMQKQTALMSAVNDLAAKVTIDASATSSSGFDLGLILIVALIVGAILIFVFFGLPVTIVKTLTDIIKALVIGTIGIVGGAAGAVKSEVSGQPPQYTPSMELNREKIN